MDFKEYDFPGMVNGERVKSISKWFEENPDFSGNIEIEIPQQEEEVYRICVKKQMTLESPAVTHPMPMTQMVGRKIANFAGFYIMELWCEHNEEIRWRGKVPKSMILQMEFI